MNEMTRIVAVAEPVRGFTALDFEQMMEIGAFEDKRVELVAGVLEKMMPSTSSYAHGERNLLIGASLVRAFAGKSVGLASDLALRIDDTTVRAPDLAVLRSVPDEGAMPSVDQVLLAIEIADTTLGRDLGAKLADYARAGIPDYWVVDLRARVVRVMSGPEGTAYRAESIVRFGEPIAVPGTEATITVD